MYESDAPRESSIHIVNVDGSGSRRLAASGHSPVWSPDGEWIAYLATDYAKTPAKVTVVHPDGTGARTVTLNLGTDVLLQLNAVSRSATSVRVRTACGDPNCGDGAPGPDAGTTIIDTETGRGTPLVADQGAAQTQVWTADGHSLVRTTTSQGSRGTADIPPSFALELHAPNGPLLARQAEPPAVETASGSQPLYVLYVP